jgi:predicted AlkP superfamily pyrophosphatase or phosphodiesterase
MLIRLLGIALAAWVMAGEAAFAQPTRPSVLLISIDGLRPDLVLDGGRHGVDLANIRQIFVGKGAHAPKGMTSVDPSLTYPNHQALITGTYPATNGIATNALFDPTGKLDGAWHWWASSKVPTLWTLAADRGYLSVNVGFPTSGGVPMDINIPDFWRFGTTLDDDILNMVATPPGLVREMLAATGITGYPGDAFDLASDRKRHAGMTWVLENKVAPQIGERPFFMTGYYASYDYDAHEHGTFSAEALANAVAIDQMVGELVAKAEAISSGNIVVALVSDHGFLDIERQVRPNVKLREAGLVQVDTDGKVAEWQAWSQRAGGMAQILVKNPDDLDARNKLESVLAALKEEPDSGVADVLSGQQIATLKTFPEASYVLVMKPGVEPRDEYSGDYLSPKLGQKATHGFRAEMPEMKASLFIKGPGVQPGRMLDNAQMVDVAPTLAYLMRVTMPTAEGVNLLE